MRGKTDLIVVFLNILCHADRDGIADIHWRVIAEETGLSIKKTRAAIKILESPDPESRSPEQEGRRLLRVDDHREWGWQIINYIKYREMRSEEDRRLYMREYMAKKRAVNKIANEKLTELTGKQELAELAKVEVDGEVDIDNPPLPPKGEPGVKTKPPFPAAEWETIVSIFPKGQRIDELARRNFQRLAREVPVENLVQSAKNYAEDFRGEFPYKLSNFFGKSAYYKSYLPGVYDPDKERNRRQMESGLPPEYRMNLETNELDRV